MPWPTENWGPPRRKPIFPQRSRACCPSKDPIAGCSQRLCAADSVKRFLPLTCARPSRRCSVKRPGMDAERELTSTVHEEWPVQIAIAPDRVLVIEPGRAERNYWRDIWAYRELFAILAWRDVAVRYKQTVIGVAWSVVRPFLTMIIFTIVFSRVAHLRSDSAAPYAVMVFAGLLPWFLFSTVLTEASNSLISNASLIGKVYFPRIVIPISSAVVALVDFGINLVMLGLLMAWYVFAPTWRLLLLPGFVVLAVLASLGPALLVTALNVKYRDFRYIIPFIVQFGLYVSPVGFSSALVPDEWRLWYSLNPIVGVIDGFRWCILGGESQIYVPGFLLKSWGRRLLPVARHSALPAYRAHVCRSLVGRQLWAVVSSTRPGFAVKQNTRGYGDVRDHRSGHPVGRLQVAQLRGPGVTATRAYILTIAAIARLIPSRHIRDLMQWVVTGQEVPWKPLVFGPRTVVIGDRTQIRLMPHLGEFDQAALFRCRLDDDASVFAWLERHATDRYDAVIDIGANVGLYSIFFDALIRRSPAGRLRRVYAFEPSQTVYCRLLANLEANDARSVEPFAVAVSNETGFAQFFQPEGHLVNGSLSRGFAELFAQPIRENMVLTVAGSELAVLLARHQRVLLKIDAEGFEPKILASMAPVLERHRPDLLIEVLQGVDAELNGLACLADYSCFHLTGDGPSKRDTITADPVSRDWLLTMSPLEI